MRLATREDDEEYREAEPVKYRYVCHGCTETALRSTSLMQGIQVTCEHCGMQQETKPENWVVL